MLVLWFQEPECRSTLVTNELHTSRQLGFGSCMYGTQPWMIHLGLGEWLRPPELQTIIKQLNYWFPMSDWTPRKNLDEVV